MKTNITRDNPFYETPNFAFGYEQIKDRKDGLRLLDYGCFDVQFGKKLLLNKKVDYFGVDKNAEIIARQDTVLQVSLATHPLSFPDDYFDVIVIFEVLEHINDQESTLKELCRVLKSDGTLILSVPRKHCWSFLDMANWKFMFPKLHKVYYPVSHSEDEYNYRYKNSPHVLSETLKKKKHGINISVMRKYLRC